MLHDCGVFWFFIILHPELGLAYECSFLAVFGVRVLHKNCMSEHPRGFNHVGGGGFRAYADMSYPCGELLIASAIAS